MATTAKKKKPVSPWRRSMYAKIAIGWKELGWSEDEYRDILAARYDGKRSGSQLANHQLNDLLEYLKRSGFKIKKRKPVDSKGRAAATSPHAGKIRALWISAWELGVVKNPSEEALNAFVKRQTTKWNEGLGIENMRFLPGEASDKVIEALKKMMTRDANVSWDSYQRPHSGGAFQAPRARVIEAQWAIINALGVVDERLSITVMSICRLSTFPGLPYLDNDDADKVIRDFGRRIRAGAE